MQIVSFGMSNECQSLFTWKTKKKYHQFGFRYICLESGKGQSTNHNFFFFCFNFQENKMRLWNTNLSPGQCQFFL